MNYLSGLKKCLKSVSSPATMGRSSGIVISPTSYIVLYLQFNNILNKIKNSCSRRF